MIRKIVAGGVAAALMLGTAVPAQARHGWGHYRPYHSYHSYHHHYGHGRFDGGDFLAGIAVVGAVAAIASAVAHDDARPIDRDGYYDDGYRRSEAIRSQGEAVDACAYAAEDDSGRYARVQEILAVEPAPDGWDVKGRLDDGPDRAGHLFRCSVRYGAIDRLHIDPY